VARRQTRRCLRVLRRRYQGRGTAPVLLERRQFGDRAHPYGHVHRQHRAAPRHGWRTADQGSGRDRAGGIHHAKQWRLDHVRQIPELTACDTGDHRLAAVLPVTGRAVKAMARKGALWKSCRSGCEPLRNGVAPDGGPPRPQPGRGRPVVQQGWASFPCLPQPVVQAVRTKLVVALDSR
jgi:hypothetical protein